MSKIYLKYKERVIGGEPESDEQWCNYSDEYTNVTFLGFSFENTNGMTSTLWATSLDIPESVYKKAKNGAPLHLVVVRYTTGSTFGTSHGRWVIVHVTDDSRKARDISRVLNNSSGEEVPSHCNIDTYKFWEGYFERYETCEIHTVGLK